MTRRLLEVTSVIAHTECGPAGECAARTLPPKSVDVRDDADLVAVAVHAQLPVGNPILDHPTFRASCALTVTCALPMPGSPMLCLYQHKEWWMRPTWVSGFAEVPQRTQMLLWRAADSRWHLLLAVSDRACRADIRGIEGRADGVAIDVSTNQAGRTTVEGLTLLYAYGDDPYMLVERCVRRAARANGIAMRDGRPFPEMLRGLGWCTWDSLGQQVSEEGIVAKMEEFRRLRVPISWVLIDDGWSRTADNKLTGFDADPVRFPHGLAYTVDVLKREYGVRHVGVWQAFHGYWGGVDSDAAELRACGYMFETLPDGMAVPSSQLSQDALACPTRSGGERFWRRWDEALAHDGIDFVKVDAQSTMSVLTRGVESFAALRKRHEVLDQIAAEVFDSALINCMGMAPENYWSRPTSPIVRTSDDFFPRIPESLPEHAIENAYCSLLMGCLYHCDWDMFWTKHPDARVHAWLRWISGGPIYCSDALGATDPQTLRPFLDVDGALTHPDGVGMPIEASLLHDPVHGDVPLGIGNTFHGDDVVLFVGLNKDAAQTAHIAAGDAACDVHDLESGAHVPLDAHETLDVELSYGEYAVFAIERGGISFPHAHSECAVGN